MPDWVLSWLLCGLAVVLLLPSIRWIHKHVQGLGYLLTNDPQGAVLIYYLALLPGVFLHEASQWVLAKILRVKIKKFRLWPEKQRGGVIRLGLVEIEEGIDIVRATLVGIVPLVAGLGVIALVAGSLNLEALLDSFGSGDMDAISAGISAFVSSPGFWLWVYIVFAIANAMMPEEHDRINWWLIVGLLAGIVVVLWLLDLSILIQFGLNGPLAQLAHSMSLALILSLFIDWLVMALIWGMERLFSRLLNREVEYH